MSMRVQRDILRGMLLETRNLSAFNLHSLTSPVRGRKIRSHARSLHGQASYPSGPTSFLTEPVAFGLCVRVRFWFGRTTVQRQHSKYSGEFAIPGASAAKFGRGSNL